MKKTIQLLGRICIVALFASCSNDDNSITTDDTQIGIDADLVVKKVTRYLPEPFEDGCLGRYGDFSEDGLITGVYLCDEQVAGMSYNDENQLISVWGIGDFEYENGRITKTYHGSDTGGGFTDITYDGNLIIERITYEGVQNSFNLVFEFTDDTYSQLISMTSYEDVDVNPYPYRRRTFEYEGNNLVKGVYEILNEDTQLFEVQNIKQYTYDDKVNPYRIGLTQQNAHVSNYTRLLIWEWPFRILSQRSDNNVLTEKGVYVPNNTEVILEYQYEYNDQNYPTSYIINTGNEEFAHGQFEYYE